MDWKIPLYKIFWDQSDIDAVTNAIKRGTYWAIGPEIEELERLIAKYIGTDYALTFNSGTSALHAIMLAYDIKKGDEVIVPSFTFISTVNAPLFTGAKPIFADIEEKTFGLDPADVRKKITEKTKAIIPIHYGGNPCKIKELKEIADEKGLILIEDAAEALGAEVAGKRTGSFGSSSVLSFCAPKTITTGEGGAITTDSGELYEKLKLIRSHGRETNENYFSSNAQMNYIFPGYNFRMSNITASLGIAQMKKIEKIIELRREVAKKITQALEKTKIKTPLETKGNKHVYQMYTIRLSQRNDLMKHLTEKGIMTKIFFEPAHSYDVHKSDVSLPVTEKVSKEVLSLPIYPNMKQEEIELVCGEINAFFK